MNIIESLPYQVLPLDSSAAARKKSVNYLNHYFVRNKCMTYVLKRPSYVEQVIRIAANASYLWFHLWTNPETGRKLIVIANKQVAPSREAFMKVLDEPAILEGLKVWSQ